MTAEPAAATEPVICGARETRPDGNHECINPLPCDGRHYYVLLVHTAAEGAA